MAVYEILKVLADGAFHSGEELGVVLGVSRTAVWKHVKKVSDFGLRLESVKGRGYRIVGGLDLLQVDKVVNSLEPGVGQLLSEVCFYPVIDSTNHHLMTQRTGSGEICLAEQQTSGRGRRGRQWVSPFARNVYLSASWAFSGGAQVLEGLSLAVGVVVVRALESIGVHGLSLKWPNDILHSGRKLGGILLEMTGDVSGECRVVVGVGLNVNMATADGELIGQQWTDLCKVAGVEIERNEVVRALLSELLPLLRDYTSRRFSHYQGEWQALDAFRGSKVKLLSADDVIYGVAGGVTESGALRLLTSTGEQIITGGEVSLREDS